ncbi:SRPBCC family protein [Planobispora longispora]|uniref:ATPase n=1 Tax=Planobispora longispora TaxID=28887 RepID=A0A8J3W5H4_9ACTN|nr:SRPBCC family protein [Planobispora longispora]GIH76787.1 ATPase [Planobispora longispora]
MTSRQEQGEGLTVRALSDTDLLLTRTFTAPRRLVFDAFTRPELLRRWHGARGWHLVVCEVDLRPGGVWRFVSRGPDGAEMGLGGVFHEVDAPGRLVHSELHDGWEEGEALVTTVFDERDGRTAMTTTVRYPSREIRDSVLRTPMERGAGEAYDRLAETLNEMTLKGELQ